MSAQQPTGPPHDPVDDERPDDDGASDHDLDAGRAPGRPEVDEDHAEERYTDSPGAALAGAIDEVPEPNEPG